MSSTPALPVDAILPEILASLNRTSNLVIEAPPGAGKTTRVPPALLSLVRGEIIVLEPRRIAARMAARRVASELGEEVGGTIGYQVRFEERIGPRTRVRFVTEGILTRRLLTDSTLKGVDAVILDEFHDRHLESDLALALLKRLQGTRPELRLVVMSATLDAAPVARYLDDCPILRSEGRLFPLSVRHLPYSPAPLHMQIKHGVQMLQAQQHTGNILAFLPGIAEIRRAARECEPIARQTGLLVLPLHGDLTPEEQDRAVLPSSERKLILATNVAESSVTVGRECCHRQRPRADVDLLAVDWIADARDQPHQQGLCDPTCRTCRTHGPQGRFFDSIHRKIFYCGRNTTCPRSSAPISRNCC